MTRFVYRCSACRTRNTFNRLVDQYIVARKCRDCGHKKFYLDRERMSRKPCYCSGYHYAHRPGSKCCEQNPMAGYWRAVRAGLPDDEKLEVFIDVAWDNPPKVRKGGCPL